MQVAQILKQNLTLNNKGPEISFKPAAVRELDELDLSDWIKDPPTLASYQMQRNRTRALDLHLYLIHLIQ